MYVLENFSLKIEEKQSCSCSFNRVRRHQLRMGKALVDIFVDDIRFIKHEIALDENRHFAVRVHDIDVFRLMV